MKSTISTIIGMTIALAMTGASFAQGTPAPAPKAAVKSTAKPASKKSHETKTKSTKKAVAATPAK